MAKFISNYTQMLLGFLVVLAFIAQSLIPIGYMPSFKSGQVFEIVICHGADQSTILVDENMNPVSQDVDQNNTDHSNPCIYTAGASKDLAFQSFIFQQIEHLTYEAYVVRSADLPYIPMIIRPYYGQGPPHFLS